ncbi:acyl-CoA thioesterase [Allomuricauda sp. d1]|uniref:acyl-CoA thioesterase n=1 Tax=Allomuricauda sp. d1 TaxID=3136725 RepID=UPI0031DC1D77
MPSNFTKNIAVTYKDLDELNHVNNIRYIEWIQEISREHWQKVSKKQFDHAFLWVVRKHDITYHHAAQENDNLLVSTHIALFHGPISKRIVEIKNNKTGQLLVRSITDWCLVDKVDLRPKRIPESMSSLFE